MPINADYKRHYFAQWQYTRTSISSLAHPTERYSADGGLCGSLQLQTCAGFRLRVFSFGSSHSDRLPVLRAKMVEYLANGARLGWLIDADARTVEVYRQGREAELVVGVDSIAGEAPVEGFVLDLTRVWSPLAG